MTARPVPELPADVPAGERQVLVQFLDWYRAVLARKADGLTRAQLNQTLGPSSLTLAGLVKHLALVEDSWFTERLAARPLPEPWASAPFHDDWDWDFHSAPHDEPAALLGLFDQACARSRAAVEAAPSLDTLAFHEDSNSGRGPWSLRWILVHMIEEYARHVGHADLLREAIDGQTGD